MKRYLKKKATDFLTSYENAGDGDFQIIGLTVVVLSILFFVACVAGVYFSL
jgi:uncharacterized membrane protein